MYVSVVLERCFFGSFSNNQSNQENGREGLECYFTSTKKYSVSQFPPVVPLLNYKRAVTLSIFRRFSLYIINLARKSNDERGVAAQRPFLRVNERTVYGRIARPKAITVVLIYLSRNGKCLLL